MRNIAQFVGMQSGKIEAGMCNYEAAIDHYREVVTALQMHGYAASLSGMRVANYVGLATLS